jgi:1-acyl-sn-glycerol-3-phosphate acyltransferase
MILTIVFWILALGWAVGLWLGLQAFSPLWLLLLVPGFYLGVVILYFLILTVISAIWSGKDPKKTSKLARVIIRISLDWICRTLRLEISASGQEKIPDCPCVIVSNHRSMFDPLILLIALPKRELVFLSKMENFGMRLPALRFMVMI